MLRSRTTAALVATAALTLVIGMASPAEASRHARITSVYFNSPGKDHRTNHSLNAEWVRIKNTTGHRITMTNWRLHDRGGKHRYHFPRFHLAARAHVKVHTGKGRNTKHNLYWGSGNYIWNNTGDKAYLNNSHAHRVDTCKWGGKGHRKRC